MPNSGPILKKNSHFDQSNVANSSLNLANGSSWLALLTSDANFPHSPSDSGAKSKIGSSPVRPES